MEFWSNWTIWLSIGFVLLILELMIPGVFLMWWGLAAMITALSAKFFPTLSLGELSTIFALFAVLFSLIWWKIQRNRDQVDDRQTDLNSREHHLIGTVGVVVEVVSSNIIRAKFGDTTWKVIGDNLQLGDNVEVLKVEGITLLVRKI